MAWIPLRTARESRERELEAADHWRTARKLANDDVTALGEELADLHGETLGSDLGGETTHHYRRALEHYDQAKERVSTSATVEDVLAGEQLLQDARDHRAAVLALEAVGPLAEG